MAACDARFSQCFAARLFMFFVLCWELARTSECLCPCTSQKLKAHCLSSFCATSKLACGLDLPDGLHSTRAAGEQGYPSSSVSRGHCLQASCVVHGLTHCSRCSRDKLCPRGPCCIFCTRRRTQLARTLRCSKNRLPLAALAWHTPGKDVQSVPKPSGRPRARLAVCPIPSPSCAHRPLLARTGCKS